MFRLIFLSILLFLPATHTNSRIAWKQHLIQNMRQMRVREMTDAIITGAAAKAPIVSPEREMVVKYGIVSYTLKADEWCNNYVNHHQFVQHSQKLLYTVKARLTLGCTHILFYTNFFDVDLGYKQLATGELDILTEPMYIGLAQMDNVSMLYPHDKDDLCFLVGAPPPLQLSLLLTVSLSIWLATAACVLGFVAAAGLVVGLSWADAAFAVLGCLITGTSQASLRRLRLWVSLLSFFLWNFLGGSLTGSIVFPGRERQFRTLEEVDAAFARIYPPPTMEQEQLQWLESQSNIYASLISKFSNLATQNDEFNPKEEALLTYETLAHIYKNEYDKDIRLIQTTVCLFSPCYVSFPVRKNWPHARFFEKLIQRSVEAGLLRKYKQEACEQSMFFGGGNLIYCSSDGTKSSGDSAKPMHLDNLKEALFICAIGYSLALACFLAENMSRFCGGVSLGIAGFVHVFRNLHIF